MRDAADRGDVEFVHEVTAGLPTRVIGQLMGLPEKDWDHIHELAERNTSTQDPDLAGEDDYSGSIEMAMYAIEFAADRRSQPPREDLTTLILESEFAGAPMTDVDFGSFFVQLVTAGNDTTKTMLSSGLHALVQHPEQLAELRADPSADARARSRKSCVGPTRCTTSGAPPRPTPNCTVWPSRPATRWRCTTRRPTATRPSSPTRRRSTSIAIPTRTWLSGSPSTSASACIWPDSRAGSSSTSC